MLVSARADRPIVLPAPALPGARWRPSVDRLVRSALDTLAARDWRVWRERALAVIHPHDRLQLERAEEEDHLRLLIVDTAEGERVALVVDAVLGRLEGVLKPLGGLLAGLPAVFGTTLAADGSVLFVLDPAELGR